MLEEKVISETDEDECDNHPVLHNGARLQALEAKHMHDILL